MVFKWWGFSPALQWKLHGKCCEFPVLLCTCSCRAAVLAAQCCAEQHCREGAERCGRAGGCWTLSISDGEVFHSPLKSFIDSLRLLNPNLLKGIGIYILISLGLGYAELRHFYEGYCSMGSILPSVHNCNNC